MRKNGVAIDIAGTGGIREPADVVKYIMAGANSVQICSVVWVEGFNVANKLLEGVTAFMERNGYNSIEDMRGIIVDKVVTDSAKFEQRIPQKVGVHLPPMRWFWTKGNALTVVGAKPVACSSQ